MPGASQLAKESRKKEGKNDQNRRGEPFELVAFSSFPLPSLLRLELSQGKADKDRCKVSEKKQEGKGTESDPKRKRQESRRRRERRESERRVIIKEVYKAYEEEEKEGR